MVTAIFVVAAAGLVLYMIRYARRYGAGQTRDTSDNQYDWSGSDSGSDSGFDSGSDSGSDGSSGD